jgi:hypothetical protein
MSQQSPKILYLLVEAGGKTYWNRAGVGFVNSDNSINLKLDMFPGLTFNLRDPKANEDSAADEPPARTSRGRNAR